MQQAFQQFILKEKLFSPQQKILLTVSGGVDSMSMALLFLDAGYTFGIAHCNFGLRGIDSDGDEYFVKEWAAKHSISFYSRHFDTEDYANRHGISIQMAARELRYEFFEELATRYDYDFIATAHHRDDAIETFFINLIRGTGISGIKGIPARSGRLIRPLMFASRAQIEAYAKEQKLKFRNDSSNDESKYQRNQLRHHVLPELLKIDPGFPETMSENLRRFEQAETIYREKIRETVASLITETAGEIRIPIARLKALNPLPAYLFEMIRKYGFNEEMCKEIIRTLQGEPGKIFHSHSHRLLTDRSFLIMKPHEKDFLKQFETFIIRENDKNIEQPVSLTIKHKSIDNTFAIPGDPTIACLDATTLTFPLTLRKWQKGDVFHPLGARGKKKLSDFFSDHKFSIFDKENCWLLVSGGRIVWVVGYRIAHFARVTDQTKKVIMFTLTED